MDARTARVRPYRGVSETCFARWREQARAVAGDLARTARKRDRAEAIPHEEIGWLRESGLLGFATPTEFGGVGGSLGQTLELGRIVAAADGAIGRLLLHHYSNGVRSYILGTDEQWELIARGVGARGWFQGSVDNPRDAGFRVVARPDGGYLLSGIQAFATDVALAGHLTVGFFYDGALIQGQIPPDRSGLRFHDDRDSLGPRSTAGGGVEFDAVSVEPHEVLRGVADFPGDRALREGLHTRFGQLMFGHLYLGIATGALEAAAAHVREYGRATNPVPTEDPRHLQLFGRLSATVTAGTALAESATLDFERALFDPDLTAERWGALAIRVDQLESVAGEAVLEATHQIFQAIGARSTAAGVGLDLYRRNARTHTTHDPLPYRRREIGAFVLDGVLPAPRSHTDLATAPDKPPPTLW
ncbi:acyl-CoA dehydrogenase family protein [Nocardia takedensis]